ncbi:MAG: reverse transcriptase-like protein [Aeromonas sp.]
MSQKNLQSALAEPEVVSALLRKEVNKGYVIGPFKSPPFSPFRVNSLFFQGQWFAERWPDQISLAQNSASSALYELYPIAVACVLWGSAWSRKHIIMFCDNEAAVAIINKGRSSCVAIMPIIRRIIWQSIMHSFTIKAEHIPRHSNEIADALSRYQMASP